MAKKRKSHITLPRSYDPGPNHPRETLAYLSPAEHELIRKLTDGKWNRGPKGVRSYADDSASSNGMSRGDNSGTKGSGGLGQGGQGGGGTSGGSKSGGSSGSSSSSSSSSSKSSSSGSTSSSSSGAGRDSSRGIGQGAGGSAIGRGGSSTATGKAADAARANAAKASGTATQWGGQQYGPGQMYSNPSRSGSALNSVLNGTRLAGLDNRQTIDAVARNMGLSNPIGRAGMIGTFDHESAGLKPGIDTGDDGTAFGLGQWRGDRQTALRDYARDMGQAVDSAGLQTAFGISEMGRSFPSTLSGLQNASSIRDAVAAMNDYEKPRGWSRGGDPTKVAGWNDRVARSQTAFGKLGAPATTSGPAVASVSSPPASMSYPGAIDAASFGITYQPDRWEQDVGFLAGRTIAPTQQEAALAGYANPYSAVDPRLIEGAAGMIRKAEAVTGATATINDAYRSKWHQGVGMAPTPGKKAQPGNSWHQAGTAIDIGYGPVQSFLNANRAKLPGAFGMEKPESLINSDRPHFQVADLSRPFPGSGLKSGLDPVGNAGKLAALESGMPQVAGLASAGMSEADRLARARKAEAGLNAIQRAATPASVFASDPRLSIPQGAFPAAPLRSTAGTYTDPYNRPTQGPQRYSGPLDSIPSPVSIGMSAPASAFANDPRLNVPQGAYPARAQTTVAGDPRLSQTPVGAFPAARPSSQVATDPRVSQTPVGAFPAAQKPASVFAEDPRISTTPLGSLPAAKPKEIQLAWNVPPMGGSLPGQAAYGLGLWGTNRPLPTGPAAQPGTIHSQTAQTEEKPSFWQQAGDLYNTASTAVTNKVEEVKADPRYQKFSQFAKDHPKLAEWGLKMMMGGGGTPNPNGMGNPQDRSRHVKPPQPMQAPQMAQAPQSAVSTNPLTILQDLQANMIAQGASEEELAYVQSLIDELTNSQVA